MDSIWNQFHKQINLQTSRPNSFSTYFPNSFTQLSFISLQVSKNNVSKNQSDFLTWHKKKIFPISYLFKKYLSGRNLQAVHDAAVHLCVNVSSKIALRSTPSNQRKLHLHNARDKMTELNNGKTSRQKQNFKLIRFRGTALHLLGMITVNIK